MRKNWIGLAVAFCLLPFVSFGQIKSLPDIGERVTYYYLDNGMEIVLVPNHSVPVIASIVLVRTGLHNELPAINGASHFLEHLLFNGTERRTQEQLYDEVDLLGAYNNAHTDWDYTSYIILAPKENFEQALDIQADMLFHSILPEDKFEKEKGIILEEIAKDKTDPSYGARLWFRRTLFGASMYSLPVLGAESSIREMTRDDVWAYYQQYYVPNNMTAFIMGDFQLEDMEQMVEQYFGPALPGDSQWLLQRRKKLTVRFGDHARFKVPGISQRQLRLAFPAPPFGSKDYYAMAVASQLLEHALRENLTQGKSPAVTDVSVDYQYHLLAQWVEVNARLSPGADVGSLERQIRKQIAEFGAKAAGDPAVAEGVQRIVRKILIQDIYDLQRPHYFAMLRSQELALGGGAYLQNYVKRFRNVTSEDVAGVVGRYLMQASPTVVLFEPLGREKEAQQAEVRQVTVRDRLQNGITVIVRQDSSMQIAGVHFLFRDRATHEPDSLKGIAELLHYVYDNGSRDLPGEAFRQRLEALGANLKLHDWSFVPYDDYYWSNSYSYIRLECLDAVLDSSLALVTGLIQAPNFSPGNVELAKRRLLGLLQRRGRTARSVAAQIMRQRLFGNPYGAPILGTAETLRRIDVQALKQFHRDYVRGENLIVSVVSALPVDSVMAILRTRLERLPGSPKPSVLERLVVPATGEKVVEKKVGGKQSAIMMGQLLRDFHLDELPALWVLNRILSDRLAFRLREEKGWAYSIGSSVSLDPAPNWIFSMGTRPENVDSSYQELLAQMKKFRKVKFSLHDLEKARNELRGQMLRRFLTRENQAFYLGLGEYLEKDYRLYFDTIDRLPAVSLKDLERVRKKYFDHPDFLIVLVR